MAAVAVRSQIRRMIAVSASSLGPRCLRQRADPQRLRNMRSDGAAGCMPQRRRYPKGDCTATVQTSCGDDGFCDGAFACRQWASGTQCTAEKCESGVGYAKELCDGLGTCQSVTGVACDPYVCGANACLTSCTTDAQCITTHYCASGSCEEKKVNGASCVTANECQSDQCVDGVCCENACDGTCSSCAVAGQLGSCTTYAASTDPDDECPTCQTCNGAGACANVSDGQDPLNECAQTPASTCGLDGVCDGSGACRQWASGTGALAHRVLLACNRTRIRVMQRHVRGRWRDPVYAVLGGGDLCASSCAADAECVTTHIARVMHVYRRSRMGIPAVARTSVRVISARTACDVRVRVLARVRAAMRRAQRAAVLLTLRERIRSLAAACTGVMV